MSQFLVHDRDGSRWVPIDRQMTIGRGSGNDLLLNAMFASRRHAWVWRQGDRVILEDLGSANGTFVNGQPVTRPQFLNPNDVIVMGDAQLTFVTRGDPSSAQTPPGGTPRWDLERTGPGEPPSWRAEDRFVGAVRSFTPTDPVVARPFPASNATATGRTGTQACLVLLLLAIVAVLLLTIAGVLAVYILGLT